MISAIGGVVTIIVGYVWLKYTVASHVEEIKAIKTDHKEYVEKIDKRLDEGVKRFEELNTHIGQLLDKDAADKTYARRELLDLHIRNMEKDIRDVKESNSEMGKKLDHLISVLSTNIVKTLTPHGAVYGSSH